MGSEEPEREPTEASAEGGLAAAEEHPEAHGFGSSKRRLRVEILVIIGLLVALPLGAVMGARFFAARLAMRLPPSFDVQLGRPTWLALSQSPERCQSRVAEDYVHALVAPLLEALGETPFEFHFMVLDSEDINAFALPGGYVVVNRGLIEKAEAGEEVVGVLAHELSHVTLRHSTRRLAGSMGAGVALGIVFGVVDLGAPALTLAHLAGLDYDRAQEREADEQGRELLRRAGISPLGMATLFERLRALDVLPELLSTHPDPGDRAAGARRAAEGFVPSRSLPAPPDFECG